MLRVADTNSWAWATLISVCPITLRARLTAMRSCRTRRSSSSSSSRVGIRPPERHWPRNHGDYTRPSAAFQGDGIGLAGGVHGPYNDSGRDAAPRREPRQAPVVFRDGVRAAGVLRQMTNN